MHICRQLREAGIGVNKMSQIADCVADWKRIQIKRCSKYLGRKGFSFRGSCNKLKLIHKIILFLFKFQRLFFQGPEENNRNHFKFIGTELAKSAINCGLYDGSRRKALFKCSESRIILCSRTFQNLFCTFCLSNSSGIMRWLQKIGCLLLM